MVVDVLPGMMFLLAGAGAVYLLATSIASWLFVLIAGGFLGLYALTMATVTTVGMNALRREREGRASDTNFFDDDARDDLSWAISTGAHFTKLAGVVVAVCVLLSGFAVASPNRWIGDEPDTTHAAAISDTDSRATWTIPAGSSIDVIASRVPGGDTEALPFSAIVGRFANASRSCDAALLQFSITPLPEHRSLARSFSTPPPVRTATLRANYGVGHEGALIAVPAGSTGLAIHAERIDNSPCEATLSWEEPTFRFDPDGGEWAPTISEQ